MRSAILWVFFLLVPVGQIGAQCPVEEFQLVASDAEEGDRFGTSVAVHGDTAVVGVPWDRNSSGAAYVFVRAGSRWSEQAILVGNDVVANDRFGEAVAIQDDTILVGSPWDDDGGSNSGSVYVFERSGTIWAETQKLRALDESGDDEFGATLAVSAGTVLIGAPHDALRSGSAYVFVHSGETWSQQAKLRADIPAIGDEFGGALSIHGDRAVIGAVEMEALGERAGAAYVFARNGTDWTEEALLLASDGQSADSFGSAVGIWDDTVLVGCVGDDEQGGASGSVYVFEFDGLNWTETDKLLADGGAPVDLLGGSISFVQETAAVGARWSDAEGDNSGAGHIFVRRGTGWTQARVTASDGAEADEFGHAIAFDGTSVLVGARHADAPLPASGSAYVFRLREEPSVYCTAKTNSCGSLPSITASGLPSGSSSSGFVVTGIDASAGKAGLLLYTDGGRAAVPFDGGTLCVAAPIRRSPPAFSGGTSGCDGVFQLDVSCFAAGGCGGNPQPFLRLPGVRVHCQWWGRDSLANGSYLTNGLEYTVCD